MIGEHLKLIDSRVAIVGVGLMGGSMALALKGKVKRIIGVDVRQAVLNEALKRRMVDESHLNLEYGLSRADIVILATPIRQIVQSIRVIGTSDGLNLVVVDLGSTKGNILNEMDKLPKSLKAIGGHPMCGKETAGLENAAGSLYRNKMFVLCRSRRTTSGAEKIILELIRQIGGIPMFMDAVEHDEIVAGTSHLPYLVSAALLRLAAESALTHPEFWRLTATGFRDMTRLAGSDSQMIADIILTNRGPIAAKLRGFSEHLEAVASIIEAGDSTSILPWLDHVRSAYEDYRLTAK